MLLDEHAHVVAQACISILLQFDHTGEDGTVWRLLAILSCSRNCECTQYGRYGTALQAASINFRSRAFPRRARRRCENANEAYGTTPQAASAGGDLELVRFHIEHGTDVNMQGVDYGTAPRVASLHGSSKLVRLPVEHGADVKMQGEYQAALQAVSACGTLALVRLLVEHSTDVDAQGGEYGTALQAATHGGYLNIVHAFLQM
ncbi:hypothetical protein OBBRIDRAFT_822260 [Obba rivulosa]|uniref:Uncharacterized protein n=1 Tax=Obba rivulosa TaxID=1052685 RepID=A0A8E2J7K8_9APHY|nr:hypothetical protein OBBRIDRAFT_822260 [Obba rivulosa]